MREPRQGVDRPAYAIFPHSKMFVEAGRLVRLFEHRVPAEYSYWCVWSPRTGKRLLIDGFVEWLQSCTSEPRAGRLNSGLAARS